MESSSFMFSILENPAPSLSLEDAKSITYQWFNNPQNIKCLASERDQNFYVKNSKNEAFVLKIANSKEALGTLDFQNKALKHLAENTTLPLPRVISDLSGNEIITVNIKNQELFVRMISFLEGRPLGDIGPLKNIEELYTNMGIFLGNLGKGLKNFKHPSSKHKLLWDMSHTHLLYELLPNIENEGNKKIAEKSLLYFTEHIEEPLSQQRTQVIHNDMNPDNVILRSSESSELAGMIDFGDMVEAPLINDLAVAASYQTVAMNDIFKGTLSLLSGFNRVCPLNADELDLLPGLIMNRIAMSVIICEWRAIDHPENKEYILGGIKKTWKTLETLVEKDLKAIATQLKNSLKPNI